MASGDTLTDDDFRDTPSVAPKAPAPATLSDADFSAATSEKQTGPGLGVRIGEEAARWGAGGAGGVLGGPAGAGVGFTAADLGIALLNHHLYGTPVNLSPSNITKSAEENVIGSYATEPIGPALGAIGKRLIGKTATEETAQAAMNKAAEENIAAKAKLDKEMGTESADLYQAAQDAAAKNKQLQGQFAQEGPQKVAAAEQKAAQGVLPEAKTAAIETATGQPPGAPTSLPQGQARIARDEEFRQTINAPLQRWRADWRQRRTDLLKSEMNKEIDPAPARDEVAKERAGWAVGRGPYSPKVENLLNSTEMLGQGITPDNARATISNVIRGKTDPATAAKYTRLVDKEIATKGQRIESDRLDQLAAEAAGIELQKPVTVKDLLARRDEAVDIASASKGPDRTAAQVVIRGIDKTLGDISTKLKPLNSEYWNHRLNFTPKFENVIRAAPRPVDAAKEIFNHPQRMTDLADLGTPEEKQRMAQLYADWVHEEGPKVIDKSHAEFLGKLLPGSKLRDPQAWVYLDRAENNVAEVVNSSPQVKARWQAAVNVAKADIDREQAQDLIEATTQDAKTLGPAGTALMRDVRAARTPEDAAKVIGQFYQNMTPASVVADAQRSGQWTFKGGQDLRQAAIKAIQQGYQPSKAWQRFKNRALYWTGPMAVGGTLLSGRPGTYITGSLIIESGAALRELLARGFQNSLKSTSAANEFFDSMMNPGNPSNMRKIARAIVRSGMADVGSRGLQAATGTSLEENQSDVR